VSELCDNRLIVEKLYVSLEGKWRLFNDPLPPESVTSVSMANFIASVRTKLLVSHPLMRLVSVENDTSQTRAMVITDTFGLKRTLKASLSDYLLVHTNRDKISEVADPDQVLRGVVMFVEVQSGSKTLLQSLAQLHLTMYIQLVKRCLSFPTYGIVIGKFYQADADAENGSEYVVGNWYFQVIRMDIDEDMLPDVIYNGRYALTVDNFMKAIKAVVSEEVFHE